jgi:hypothetical protein
MLHITEEVHTETEARAMAGLSAASALVSGSPFTKKERGEYQADKSAAVSSSNVSGVFSPLSSCGRNDGIANTCATN